MMAVFLSGLSRFCTHLHVSNCNPAPLFQVLDDPAEDNLHMGTHVLFLLLFLIQMFHSSHLTALQPTALRTYAADVVHPTFMLQVSSPRAARRGREMFQVTVKTAVSGKRPTLPFCDTLKPKSQTLRDRAFCSWPRLPSGSHSLPRTSNSSHHFSFRTLLKTQL